MPLIKNLKSAFTLEYPTSVLITKPFDQVKPTEQSVLSGKQNSLIKPPEPILYTNQDSLRIIIGLLGILLPVILWAGLLYFGHHAKPLASISHYYYTRVNSAFTSTLVLLSIALLIYKGGKPIDFWLSATAGTFALCVVFFPTSNLAAQCNDKDFLYSIAYIDPKDLYTTFHFISAGIFLFCLALISYFRFPKDDSSQEEPSRLDQFMYKASAIVMGIAMATILLGNFGTLLPREWFDYPNSGTFWGETVAVWAFGYSWLLKAGFFAKLSDFVFK